jgi:hypothetical protein
MAAYHTQQINVGSVQAPDVGSIFTNLADRLNTNYQQGLTRAIEADKLEKDQKRWDITNARADAQEKRAADEYERQIREKQATNDAVRAVVDPNGYKASKMAAEQRAIEESIANLSPEDQVVARAEIAKNYNPEVSGRGWVDTASTAQGVDVGRVLDTKSRQYEIAAKTPGTPEYVAAENAKMDLFKREQAISHENRMAEIGAQAGAQLSYLKAQQDAPQKMVNPTTGEAKYVKPSELEKYPGYMDASTYTATLTDKRERDERDKEFRRKISETTNKAKVDLAETLQSYDADSRSAVIAGTNEAASIIRDYNEKNNKNVGDISYADINALVKRSKGVALVPWGRDDMDNDGFRSALAGEISKKTGQPVEEILKRLEGVESSTATAPASSSRDSVVDTPSSNKPFSMFGVTAPTTYDPRTPNVGVTSAPSKYQKDYDLLPSGVKQLVTFDKYIDNPNFYNRQYLGR